MNRVHDRKGEPRPESASDLFMVVAGRRGECCPGTIVNPTCAALDEVLVRLSLSATCCLAPARGRVPDPMLMGCIERVRAHLVEYPFCQLNLRPVHCVPSDTEGVESLLKFYSSLQEIIRPFQEEGFRNQIVSRLRIFPILWFERPGSFPLARPALKFLQENFFLPSLYVARAQVQEWGPLLGEDGATGPFERVFVGKDGSLESDNILDNLFITTLIERFLSPDITWYITSSSSMLCDRMIYLSEDGFRKSCVLGLPSKGTPRACTGCVLSGLDAASVAFKRNGRALEFGYLCERIGSWLFDSGDREAALQAWRKGAAIGSEHERSNEVLLKMAVIHYEKQELDSAMECLRSALTRNPDSAEIRYQMGLCEYAWKDYIESADRFEEALRLGLTGSLKTEAEYMKGLSHYHIQEYEEAIEALEKALSGGKRDSPVLFYLGLSWLGRGNPGIALRYLLEALSLGPSEEDLFHVLFYVAYAHKELGRYEEALEVLEKAGATGQARKEVMNLAGFCLFKLRRYDEAIECFRICLEIDPRSAIDWANIGSCLRDKGDREGAVAMYRKALSLDPGIQFARESLERLTGDKLA